MDLLLVRGEVHCHAEGEVARQELYQLPQQLVVSVGCLNEYLRLTDPTDPSGSLA